jgi:cobalamin transport system ATP-binding protein
VLSTHDLELALRTADVIWLLLPGGDVVTGAPEDVMVSGAISMAFEGRQIRFHPEERSFRWLTGERGSAQISGGGLRAEMVRAVLEREGYSCVADGRQPRVTVQIDDAKWIASADGTCVTGDTFRALAAYVRTVPLRNEEETES